ncbi:unnamed protein product [Owenia fusiformis]|uniref:DH domain-containing protein n=1 Tax=Owenia fusiformis TaxID=6347 RepID=A0A8S4PBI8_OWEFU|nr:unnamed protein product [Owenia fusiformis]
MEEGENKGNLAAQIFELQEMVREMKDGFSTAIEELAKIQYDDKALQEKLETNKAEHQKQLTDVVQMVLSLKTEFGGVVSQLKVTSESQQSLKEQVQHLKYERDVLLEELEKHGAISGELRSKYDSGQKSRPTTTHYNPDESQLAVLLERAHVAFSQPTHITSDHDSGVTAVQNGSSFGETTPPVLSPMVQSFIDGLHSNHGGQENTANEVNVNYDSDSSLHTAGQKRLNLPSMQNKQFSINQSDSSDAERNGNIKSEKTFKEREMLGNNSPFTLQDLSMPKLPQTNSSSHSQRKVAPHEETIRETHRTKIARDLLESERKYCSALWAIQDNFVDPLHQAAVIEDKDISIIFPGSLSRIYECHCNLLHKLEERLLTWKSQGLLGDIFTRMVDSNESELLGLYKNYIQEFPLCISMLQNYQRQSVKFRKFLKKCEKHPACEGMDVVMFLVSPIKRIPQYVLIMQQLLKFTDRDQPDHYFLQSSVQKLRHFLSQMHDGIEHSTNLIQGESYTGTKRQSNSMKSGSSGYDPLQFSSATRDSGVHSTVEDQHTPFIYNRPDSATTQTTSNIYSSYSDFMSDGLSVPNQSSRNSSAHNTLSNSTGTGGSYSLYGNRDQTFSHFEGAHTAPRPHRDRRKKRNDHVEFSTKPPSGLYRNDIDGATNPAERLHQRKLRNQRSKSMFDQMSEASFHSRVDSKEDEDYSDMNQHRHTVHSLDYNQWDPQNQNGGQMGFSNGNISEQIQDTSGQDFGIYGDNDSVNGDIGTQYEPSLSTREALTRRAQKLGQLQKSKSQGDILIDANSESPMQQRINMSLAKSLAEEKFISKVVYAEQPISEKPKKKTQKPQRVTLPDPPPDRVKENVWNESQPDVSQDNGPESNRRKELRRKKKEKQRQILENMQASKAEDPNRPKKKSSFRDSLKNLFNRKRGQSRVVEIGSVDDFTDLNIDNDVNHTPVTPSIHVDPPEFNNTYEDENGDPCSAV